MRGLRSLDKFTYFLETDEEDGMGRSEERSVINDKFTYRLETDEEVGCDDQMRGL